MFHKQSKPRGKDSLDFGSALPTLPETSGSITLWGPGVKVQEDPSSILSQRLYAWRKDSAQLPAAKAADELHNLYENLPPEALELTFQDMMGRQNSAKGKSNAVARKIFKKFPQMQLHQASAGGGVKDGEHANEEPSKDKESAPKVSLFAKISLMLTPKEVYAHPERTTLTQEDLARLVERQRRKLSKASGREGLYSASTTPTTSFRRVSPIPSPQLSPSNSFHYSTHQVASITPTTSFRRVSPIPSPQLSPTHSFNNSTPQVASITSATSATSATSFRQLSSIPSPQLSPSLSFNDSTLQVDEPSLGGSPKSSPSHPFRNVMLQVDGHSFGVSPKLSPTPSSRDLLPAADGLSNAATSLASYQPEGQMPRAHEGSHHHQVLLRSPEPTIARTTRGKDAKDCSTCSASNLLFLKTNCVICGKAFCPTCRALEMTEVFGGRRCKMNCGEGQQSPNNRLKMVREKGQRKGKISGRRISLCSCMPGQMVR